MKEIKQTNLSHPEYQLWKSMIRRIRNPRGKSEKKTYKGLTIDPRWLVFKTFINDMGPRPNKKLSIDRIDNTKGYFKDNCRWATKREQAQNSRLHYECLYGHEWTVETTFWTHNGKRKVRRCKICLEKYRNARKKSLSALKKARE